MLITLNKNYEAGDKVTCIIASNSYLERGKEYTVELCRVEYGDTIQLITSNQLGQKLYKVINEKNQKSLFIVASADISEWDTDYNYSDEIIKYIQS